MKTINLDIPRTAEERISRETAGIWGLIKRIEARASDGRFYHIEDEDREKAISYLKGHAKARGHDSTGVAPASIPAWQQIQFGLLMGKLSDWRDADHEDAIAICRSDVIAIIALSLPLAVVGTAGSTDK